MFSLASHLVEAIAKGLGSNIGKNAFDFVKSKIIHRRPDDLERLQHLVDNINKADKKNELVELLLLVLDKEDEPEAVRAMNQTTTARGGAGSVVNQASAGGVVNQTTNVRGGAGSVVVGSVGGNLKVNQ